MTDQDYANMIAAVRRDMEIATLRLSALYADLRADGHGNAITRHAHNAKDCIRAAATHVNALIAALPPTVTNTN